MQDAVKLKKKVFGLSREVSRGQKNRLLWLWGHKLGCWEDFKDDMQWDLSETQAEVNQCLCRGDWLTSWRHIFDGRRNTLLSCFGRGKVRNALFIFLYFNQTIRTPWCIIVLTQWPLARGKKRSSVYTVIHFSKFLLVVNLTHGWLHFTSEN